MKITLILTLTLHLSFSAFSQSRKTIKEIYVALDTYTKEWEFSKNKTFQNADMIKLIEKEKWKNKPSLLSDTILLYSYSISSDVNDILKRKNNKFSFLIKKNESRNSSTISFSRPILSIDKCFAFVHITTYIGPLQSGTELFILNKNGQEWVIIKRLFLTIS